MTGEKSKNVTTVRTSLSPKILNAPQDAIPLNARGNTRKRKNESSGKRTPSNMGVFLSP